MSKPNWFVTNLSDCPWMTTQRFGPWANLELHGTFPHFGVNVHILQPGQPACLYHRENQQEDFLVLHGACKVLIEEQEVPLKAWDFVHCEPGATHVFVGAGDGPCAILMIGARRSPQELTYPVSPLAAKYGASAAKETNDPREAYAGTDPRQPTKVAWPLS